MAAGNELRIVDAQGAGLIEPITRYDEVGRLAYRPDGQRLAVAICSGQNRIVELAPPDYSEVGVVAEGDSCAWDLAYSPDGQSLAATLPTRLGDPLGARYAKLVVVGRQPVELGYDDLGSRIFPALAYGPAGRRLAVATHDAIRILDIEDGYSIVQTLEVGRTRIRSLSYTHDGSFLLVATDDGSRAFDARRRYAEYPFEPNVGGATYSIAVDPAGKWIAVGGQSGTTLHRSPDLAEVAVFAETRRAEVAFSRDGSRLMLFDSATESLRVIELPGLQDVGRVELGWSRARGVFQPDGQPRTPVLFVHGHGGSAVRAWFEKTPLAMVDTLAANPGLRLDAFFVDLPIDRSIADDAADLEAMISGGVDRLGLERVGILRMPAYREEGRASAVALVGHSKGGMSSRYYIRELMPSEATVSKLVLLASPAHGLGAGWCADSQSDLGVRQLCGGRKGTLAKCGASSCGPGSYPESLQVVGGVEVNVDQQFLEQLIGRQLGTVCGAAEDENETPRHGELGYANFYAEKDFFGLPDPVAGAEVENADCLGRRVARLLSPHAENRALSLPRDDGKTHEWFPHYWKVICMTLRTLSEDSVPEWEGSVGTCSGLHQPPVGE